MYFKQITKHHKLGMRQAEPTFLQIPIKNLMNCNEIFDLKITGAEKEEVFLVREQDELRHWSSKGYLDELPNMDWNAKILPDREAVELQDDEQINLLIKFFTLREPVSDL